MMKRRATSPIWLCAILGGAPEERTKSFFATPSFEIMKYNGRGTKGHIAISTPNLERAIWHMRRARL